MCTNKYEEAAIYGYDPKDVDSGEFDTHDLVMREMMELRKGLTEEKVKGLEDPHLLDEVEGSSND